ncbi:AAA family ATPase [Desulfobacter vibrioformis]|uniref:AAA family ATPase n=1 Tax=Desulfobacter vibrioformis TaxID=34031 RepID=UPI000A0797A4|nr:MoxR family ATPase [Desulfobacter vibrioformis]
MLHIKENAVTHLPPQGTWPASVHVWEKTAVLAVNTALTARRPLLVRGEPGTGKSQLARAAAMELGRVFITEVINAKSESRDLQYHFDAVRRLGEAQALGAAGADAGVRLDPIRFLSPGPLWWCLNWDTAMAQAKNSICGVAGPVPPDGWDMSKGSVLLLDEIDKADADLPNGLLETLGNGGFSVPYTRHTVCLAKNVPSPLVMITTNEERELPAAFLRRCMVLHIGLPTTKDDFIAFLADRGRIHFPDDHSDDVRKEAARQLWNDRKDALDACQPAPGQAEYLDVLRALKDMAENKTDQLAIMAEIKDFAFKKYPDERF